MVSADGSRIVACDADQLFTSANGGASWTQSPAGACFKSA
jgi:hypothetical protein